MSSSRRPGNARAKAAKAAAAAGCPHRAARVMRVRNGIRAWREARRGVRGEGRDMPSGAPRRWRGGAMGTSRPTATGHARCARRRGRGEGREQRRARRWFFIFQHSLRVSFRRRDAFSSERHKKREDGRPLFGIAYEAQQSPKCGDRRYRVNQGNSVLFLQQLDGRRTRLRHDCDPIGFQQLSIHVGCGNQPLTRELEIGNIHF